MLSKCHESGWSNQVSGKQQSIYLQCYISYNNICWAYWEAVYDTISITIIYLENKHKFNNHISWEIKLQLMFIIWKWFMAHWLTVYGRLFIIFGFKLKEMAKYAAKFIGDSKHALPHLDTVRAQCGSVCILLLLHILFHFMPFSIALSQKPRENSNRLKLNKNVCNLSFLLQKGTLHFGCPVARCCARFGAAVREVRGGIQVDQESGNAHG